LVLAQPLVPTVRPSIEEGFVSTSYGKKERAPIVRLTQDASNTCFLTVVYPYKHETPKISITAQQIPDLVRPVGGKYRATVSITITHTNSDQYCDELVFLEHQIHENDSLVPSCTDHVCITRTGRDGRPLFKHHA
ncbi:MAG TPA: hypothetical protein DEA71_17880, partial [Nitrospira sp.]|nr:hypothetical protein [Nitrospira sp.]